MDAHAHLEADPAIQLSAFACLVRLNGTVAIVADNLDQVARRVIDELADGHRREDVDAYLAVFDPNAVWVTSRGRCFRGRDALDRYPRDVIPGGLGAGSVRYRVESVYPVSNAAAAMVVEQTYTDEDGEPRDAGARHTHTYVVALRDNEWRIVAGQNTVRRDR